MAHQLLAALCAALVLVIVAADNIENIHHKAWLRSGQTTNDFGEPLNNKGLGFLQVTDAKGKAVQTVVPGDKSYQIAHDPDFTSVIKTPSGRIFSVSSYEYTMPSGHYISELKQDPLTGKLTAISTNPVDWSKWGGIMAPCAGSQSPWNTHMAGEELCPDAKGVDAATSFATMPSSFGESYAVPMARYWGLYNVSSAYKLNSGVIVQPVTFAAFKNLFNPYRYGWALEIVVDSLGRTTTRKLYTLGRTNMELPICMPDKKTCYVSDDSAGAVLTKFVANRAADLTSGTLYAAKATQVDSNNGGEFTISWVKLGSGTQAEIKAMIDGRIKFAQIFSVASPSSPGVCPATFSPVNTGAAGFECIKLMPGKEKAAAFLETRRYAALLGATTEFNRNEGMDVDPDRKVIYFSSTAVQRSMEDNHPVYDLGGPNHIRVPKNACGCVYAAPLDNNWSMTSMKGMICGTPVDPTTQDYTGQACDVNNIAMPDNIAVIKGTNTVIIYEDCLTLHNNNVMWAIDVTEGPGSLTRILSAVVGAENTSGNYVRNLNGWDYLISVVQHPYEWGNPGEIESFGPAAYVGYMGPFPNALMQGGASLQFNEVSYVGYGVDVHHITSTDSVVVN